MTAPAPEAVIWDYGGVIATSPFRGMSRAEEALGLPPGSVSELMFGASYAHGDGEDAAEHDWHLLEKGRLTVAEYVERLDARAKARYGQHVSFTDLSALGGGTIGIHWEMVHCIRAVKARGLKTAILTNNIAEYGEYWLASFPSAEVDVIVDSSRVGMRKPEPAIYAHTAAELAVDPAACVFLDDVEANVAAARSVGMRAIHVSPDVRLAIAELESLLSASRRSR
jgi:epoxide hydrolase-like predicted phosphatase